MSHNSEPVDLDDHDLRIQHAAGRVAGGLIAMQILGLVAALAVAPQVFSAWIRPLLVGNALIGLLIAKTLTENVYTAARYWGARA